MNASNSHPIRTHPPTKKSTRHPPATHTATPDRITSATKLTRHLPATIAPIPIGDNTGTTIRRFRGSPPHSKRPHTSRHLSRATHSPRRPSGGPAILLPRVFPLAVRVAVAVSVPPPQASRPRCLAPGVYAGQQGSGRATKDRHPHCSLSSRNAGVPAKTGGGPPDPRTRSASSGSEQGRPPPSGEERSSPLIPSSLPLYGALPCPTPLITPAGTSKLATLAASVPRGEKRGTAHGWPALPKAAAATTLLSFAARSGQKRNSGAPPPDPRPPSTAGRAGVPAKLATLA
jgi:hypothetical protein